MRKENENVAPRRVLARLLAVEELSQVGGAADTTWTDGTPRKDFTQISAGDVPGTPPENQV